MNYIAIIHKDKNSEYGVSFPDFDGCVTCGRTIDEAKDMAIEALNFHIDGMREDGIDIPTPATLEHIVTTDNYTGSIAVLLIEAKDADKTVRVNITMAQSDLSVIDAAASAAGMKRSTFLVQAGLGHVN